MTLRTLEQRGALEDAARTTPKALTRLCLYDGMKPDFVGHLLLCAGYKLDEVKDLQASDGLWDELARKNARAVKAYGFATPKKTVVEALFAFSDTHKPSELKRLALALAAREGAESVTPKKLEGALR